MILEDNRYDPKKAVLASQKMVERDKIFAMIGPGWGRDRARPQDILFDAGVLQLFPLDRGRIHFKFDPAKPQERFEVQQPSALCRDTRAALKYMIEAKNFKKSCIIASGR